MAMTVATNITFHVAAKVLTTTKEAVRFTHIIQDAISETSPTFEREIAMGVLIALYLSTQIAKLILPRLFPRISTITGSRQRQLFTLWPMMVLKVIVCLLMAEAEYATRFRPLGSFHTKPFGLIQHQTNIFYILVLGYIFELLHRPNPIELDFHHVFVLMGYTYYRVRFAHLLSSETATSASTAATCNLFHLVAIMVIYGVGPVDLASETMRFIYYAIAPKAWSAQIMKFCAASAWLGRFAQWVVMLKHLNRSVSGLVQAWGWFEMGICAAFIAYWIWMETVEIFFLIGLAKRYAGKVVWWEKGC